MMGKTATEQSKGIVKRGGRKESVASAPGPQRSQEEKPGSSVLAGHPDEVEGRRPTVHEWMRGTQPLGASTPAVGGATADARLSYVLSNQVRDVASIPGNIHDAGASIKPGRMFSFGRAQAVRLPTSWGPEVERQLYHGVVRPVYLYLTDNSWITAVGKGEGDMPTTVCINGDLYKLYIC